MKIIPVSKITYILILLIVITPIRASFALDKKNTFFTDLDSTVQNQQGRNAGKKNLIVERYLRLIARLSIFGLYCDHKNKMGYSTRVSVLQRDSIRLEKWTEEIFGSIGAYNRFEKYRSQESLRYVLGERVRTCNISEAQFLFFTGMAPKDFRIYLSDPPFGSL